MRQQGHEAGPVGPPEPSEQVVAAKAAVPRHDQPRPGQHDQVGAGAGEPRPGETEGGQAEGAEDQQPAEPRVERDRGQGHRQRPERTLDRRQERAQYDEAEVGQQAPLQGVHERHGPGRDRRVLSHGEQDPIRMPHHEPHRHADHHRAPKTLADRAPHLAHRMAVAPERHGDHRHGGRDEPHAEIGQRLVEACGQDGGREFLRAEPADHHHVDGRDRDLGQVGEDQRPAERQRGADLHRPQIAPPDGMAERRRPGMRSRLRHMLLPGPRRLSRVHTDTVRGSRSRLDGVPPTSRKDVLRLGAGAMAGASDAACTRGPALINTRPHVSR